MKIQLRARPRPRSAQAGFTLIELMVTVLIVAILAGIGYPSYRNYVIRGQIVSATNGLAEMRANMERYFQDNRTYATGTFTTPCAITPSPVYGTFTVSCYGTPTATSFSLQAVGNGNMAGFTYFVDQQNTQTTTVVTPAPSSWTTGSPFACWITKAGGC
jgi:type IV pilus assembly protein PilE